MRLLNTYANYVGVLPGQAFIDEFYYPIPFATYIVVHNSTGMMTKSYDYFDEVVSHIKMPIVQIGGKDDPLLPNVVDLRGKTTWNQSAFIINHACLFLGGDSVCAHFAAHFGIPSIVLWGGTLPNTCSTTWNQDKVINMNPVDRYGCYTACHSNQCIKPNKCINSITAFSVLEKVASIIGKEFVVSMEIVHKGDISKVAIVEWVPLTLNQETFSVFSIINGIISVRLDKWAIKIEELSNFLSQVPHKLMIVTEPVDFSKFNIHHSRIEQIMILVNSNNILEGIKLMKELTGRMYKTRLISYDEHSSFNDYKIDMLDFPPMARLKDFEPNESHNAFIRKEYNIKSNRRIIGKDGRLFFTFYDALNDKNVVEIGKDNATYTIEESHIKEFQFLTIRKYI